ncbi:MAG: pectinesterase family protein [Bryobacteraceae bacterium]
MPTRREFLAAAGLPAAVPPMPNPPAAETIRAVVAADGGGDFQTIQRAVDHVLDHPPENVGRVILEIRPGVYRERVKIPQDAPRVTLAGSDAASTVITYSVGAAAAGGTFFSPVVEVDGPAFEAVNISFENSFGTGTQAVALSIHSDRAVFRNCRLSGWQDTLYAASGRQYYRDCFIEGRVDFIFGNAAAVFDGCEIHSRGGGCIAAHRRTRPDDPTGFVFRDCRLTAPGGSPPLPKGPNVFLGRPWRSCARVVFLNCRMGGHIRPEGWDNWGNAANEKTAWFAEFGSAGPGAEAAARVAWARILAPEAAAAFAPEVFLRGGDGWDCAAPASRKPDH